MNFILMLTLLSPAEPPTYGGWFTELAMCEESGENQAAFITRIQPDQVVEWECVSKEEWL